MLSSGDQYRTKLKNNSVLRRGGGAHEIWPREAQNAIDAISGSSRMRHPQIKAVANSMQTSAPLLLSLAPSPL